MRGCHGDVTCGRDGDMTGQVTMDSCKWLYALWLVHDPAMSPVAIPGGGGEGVGRAQVRNSDIVEDLGQVL